MKLILGPRVSRALGKSDEEINELIDPSNEHDVAIVRLRLFQAIAATKLSDMSGQTRLVIKDGSKQKYRLRLKLTWEWPVPVALDITVIDEKTWEVELVKDETEIN